jgi:HK97 family phage prohead protease
MKRKFLPTAAKTDGLGERQVRVIVSTPDVDRAGDIVIADGVDLSSYKANPIVLWNHSAECPVAKCVDIAVKNGAIEALVQFPPEGDDAEADKLYLRIKNGVVNAASIGFNPLKAEPIKGAGLKYTACELMEFSFVSVPANAEALVVERSAATATKDAPKLKIKGLYGVANLAYLLADLGYIEESAEWEADYEGDDSPVPQMLHEALRQLGEALIAMTVEEVGELLAEEMGQDKAAAIAKIKNFRAIQKAARALSTANDAEIKAACELMQGATGGRDEIAAPLKLKSADMAHYRRKARLAALRGAIA